jgi:uncharacterized protein YPO0396
MKRLNRIILVNWYLIGAAEIPVEGHTAFIGPNASGKSSILDAIQTVLLGGHGHYLSLNPSAGEKSTRSVRDYCLGVVRDPDNPDLSSEYQPRRQAISYLVLSFLDERTGDETAVGLALHASLEQPREYIDGRFIAPGLSLLLADLLDRQQGGRIPKPWARVREDLRARCPGFQTEAHPEKFVEQLGAVLSHDGSQHLDSRRFLRNFKNAITFTPIRNVSDFVRRYVLEDLPIRVQELQRSLQSYRDISTKTKEVKARVEDLKLTNELYRKAERAEALAAQYAWVGWEAEYNALGAESDPLEESLAGLRARIEKLEAAIREGEDKRAALTERLAELKAQLKASDVAQRKARIAAERQAAQAELGRVAATLDRFRRELAAVWRLLDQAPALPGDFPPVLERSLVICLRKTACSRASGPRTRTACARVSRTWPRDWPAPSRPWTASTRPWCGRRRISKGSLRISRDVSRGSRRDRRTSPAIPWPCASCSRLGVLRPPRSATWWTWRTRPGGTPWRASWTGSGVVLPGGNT